ncbi:SMP-30/gluconolactonase/LRE family protein [Paenibacillus tarimensis]
MKSKAASLVHDTFAELGEGPSWDERNQVLYWVDITGKKLHMYNPQAKENKTVDTGKYIGAVVPRRSGGVVMALQDGFYAYHFETGEISLIGKPEDQKPGTRFNDGKCDAAGRFWAGTMSLNGTPEMGALYCLDTDFSIRKVIDNVSVSNGITWSPDHKKMYYIDSDTKQVVAYDFDLETAAISNRKVIIDLTDGNVFPDGMTSDEEGMLWIALWDGHSVTRWNPNTGERLETVHVPAARSSSCIFGGPALNELYITSARIGLNEEALSKQPSAGGLFTARMDVKGLPTYAFGG